MRLLLVLLLALTTAHAAPPKKILFIGNSYTGQIKQAVVGLIAALPAEHRTIIEPVFNRVSESTRRRRRILNLVQDALSQLRLDMKYLVFDLEATRRERDEARQELEEGTNRGDE